MRRKDSWAKYRLIVRQPGEQPQSWVTVRDHEVRLYRSKAHVLHDRDQYRERWPEAKVWIERIWYWCPPLTDQRAHRWLHKLPGRRA